MPGFVVDKYFHGNGKANRWNARVGKAICANCVVLPECRDRAFNNPGLQVSGVIGGVSVHEIKLARSWRRFEQGQSERPPQEPRPTWLSMTEATDLVEASRVAADPDERALDPDVETNHQTERRNP